jgi:hypothetical protein
MFRMIVYIFVGTILANFGVISEEDCSDGQVMHPCAGIS